MKPLTINYFNGFVLIAAGLYGYFSIVPQSVTALIPAFAGILFVILGLFWNKNPRTMAHIAISLAVLMFAMCIWRFLKIDLWSEPKYIFLICILSNFLAIMVFAKSFVDARKVKNP
ncbi:MAG: hypothetical protein WCY25_10525 [Moheibacter sp.]